MASEDDTLSIPLLQQEDNKDDLIPDGRSSNEGIESSSQHTTDLLQAVAAQAIEDAKVRAQEAQEQEAKARQDTTSSNPSASLTHPPVPPTSTSSNPTTHPVSSPTYPVIPPPPSDPSSYRSGPVHRPINQIPKPSTLRHSHSEPSLKSLPEHRIDISGQDKDRAEAQDQFEKESDDQSKVLEVSHLPAFILISHDTMQTTNSCTVSKFNSLINIEQVCKEWMTILWKFYITWSEFAFNEFFQSIPTEFVFKGLRDWVLCYNIVCVASRDWKFGIVFRFMHHISHNGCSQSLVLNVSFSDLSSLGSFNFEFATFL